MLRGQYKIKMSFKTEPEQILKTMAIDPLMFHLYKRGDFQSKAVSKNVKL